MHVYTKPRKIPLIVGKRSPMPQIHCHSQVIQQYISIQYLIEPKFSHWPFLQHTPIWPYSIFCFDQMLHLKWKQKKLHQKIIYFVCWLGHLKRLQIALNANEMRSINMSLACKKIHNPVSKTTINDADGENKQENVYTLVALSYVRERAYWKFA